MVHRFFLLGISCSLVVLFSCKKERPITVVVTPPPVIDTRIYNESVFYVQNSNDYFVGPRASKHGTFSSFPDGLNIDQNTGIINVNKSETGLKYRISFTPTGSTDVQTAYIVISGINYRDKIFNLSAGDSIAAPIYNADSNLPLPAAGNVFDQSGGCKDAGIIVGSNDGIINLAQTVRSQGIDTGSTAEVKLVYTIADASHGATNGLDVKIYFYRTASEIPQYLLDILAERKTTILTSSPIQSALRPPVQKALNSFNIHPNNLLLAKPVKPGRPRPPCIVVVSR